MFALLGLAGLVIASACNDAADDTQLLNVGGSGGAARGDAGADDGGAGSGGAGADDGGSQNANAGSGAASSAAAGGGPPVSVPDAGTPPDPPCVTIGGAGATLIDDFDDGDAFIAELGGRKGHWSNTDPALAPAFVAGVGGSHALQLGSGTWTATLNQPHEAACAFDASTYVGLRFWARSEGLPSNIRIWITVASPECRDSARPRDCLDFYAASVENVGLAGYELAWKDFDFSHGGPSPVSPEIGDVATLYEIGFEGGGVAIDDVELMVGACGSGVCDDQRPCLADCCGNGVCDPSEYSGSLPLFSFPTSRRWGLSPTFCAQDCTLDHDGCPTGELTGTLPLSVSGNTNLSTDEFMGSCGSYNSGPHPDAEYTFTAPAAGNYLFVADANDVDDVVLHVRNGWCGDAELVCRMKESFPTRSAAVTVSLVAGQTVTAIVDAAHGALGPFTLAVSALPGVCPDQYLGSVLPLSVQGTTVGKDNGLVLACGGVDLDTPDYSYTWTPPSAGWYLFDLAGSAFDAALQLRDGSSCAGPQIACRRDYSSVTQPSISTLLAAGQTVVVSIDGIDASGTYNLSIVAATCPHVDLGSSVPLAYSGTSTGMPNVIDVPVGASGADVTLRWTAPAAGTYVFDTLGSSFATKLVLFDGANCTGTVLALNDPSPDEPPARLVAELAQGQTVTLLVDGSRGESGDFTLQIVQQ